MHKTILSYEKLLIKNMAQTKRTSKWSCFRQPPTSSIPSHKLISQNRHDLPLYSVSISRYSSKVGYIGLQNWDDGVLVPYNSKIALYTDLSIDCPMLAMILIKKNTGIIYRFLAHIFVYNIQKSFQRYMGVFQLNDYIPKLIIYSPSILTPHSPYTNSAHNPEKNIARYANNHSLTLKTITRSGSRLACCAHLFLSANSVIIGDSEKLYFSRTLKPLIHA